jgi:hypothetical protein
MSVKRVVPFLAVFLLFFAGTRVARAADPVETKSALESDPTGWLDLLADKDLGHWKRVSIPPGSKLKAKNPWSFDSKTNLLVCDGEGIHEMLLYQEEFGDGIFHVEWRFRKVEGKKGYNSGVYVRTSEGGKIWHQAQVGDVGAVGYIFGDTLVNGQIKRIRYEEKGPKRGKPPGEWNAYEVTCKGKDMTLWINGAITAKWNTCEVPKGHVGLEAEGWYIEFRNVKFKR